MRTRISRNERLWKQARNRQLAEFAMGLMMAVGVIGWLFTFLFVATN
jgi:hypothetical protein